MRRFGYRCKPQLFPHPCRRVVAYNIDMLVRKDSIIDVPIMGLDMGVEIARTEQPIIDPRYLKIYAFYCHGPHLDHDPSVLHVEDIREISELGFIVNGPMNLMSPDDLVRLKEVMDFNFVLEGKMVVDDHRQKIGKVANYIVDTSSFQIMQLSVTPGLWKSIGTTEIQIGRQQIVEITEKEIVVKAPTEKVQVRAAAPAPHTVVQNPFRRAHPQPDGIHAEDN
jgi:hypothetical protein